MPESSTGGRSGKLTMCDSLPPIASTRDRNVSATTDCASPTWWRTGKELPGVSANCAKTDAFSVALRPQPTSASTDVAGRPLRNAIYLKT